MSFLCKIQKTKNKKKHVIRLFQVALEPVRAESSLPAAVGTDFSPFSPKKTKMKRRRAQAYCACVSCKKENDENRRFIASSRADYRRLENLNHASSTIVYKHCTDIRAIFIYFYFLQIVWYIKGENKTVKTFTGK